MAARNPIARKDLTNQQWQRLQPLLPKPSPKAEQPTNDHHTIINSILWFLRTGAPWRDCLIGTGLGKQSLVASMLGASEDYGSRF